MFCGVGVRPGFFCTETARGPRRATEKPPPPTQCRHWRRHKMLPATLTRVSAPDCCFNPPLRQSTAIANPKSRAVRSRSASTANLSGLRGPRACLRVKTKKRMNERATCPLPICTFPFARSSWPGHHACHPARAAFVQHVIDQGWHRPRGSLLSSLQNTAETCPSSATPSADRHAQNGAPRENCRFTRLPCVAGFWWRVLAALIDIVVV